MAKKFWLMKSEPSEVSVDDALAAPNATVPWTGVRNYQARNHLRAMEKGDLVFFYHSVSEKQIVGLAKVAKEVYPDPTATEGDWSCVDLIPLKPLPNPLPLERIKADRILKDLPLVKNSRLSVTPVNEVQFKRILELAELKTLR